MAQSIKCPTLDFSSGLDEIEPSIGHRVCLRFFDLSLLSLSKKKKKELTIRSPMQTSRVSLDFKYLSPIQI